MKYTLNFEHSQEKMTLIADVFTKLRIPKNVVKLMSKQSRVRGPFDKQHGKGHQKLSESELHHIQEIY